MTTFNFSQSSLSKLLTVDNKLQYLAIKVLEVTPIDFAITEGFRTIEEQQRLYEEGKSKCDGINNKSKHQEGKAIDICPVINNKLDYTATDDLYFLLGLFYLKAKELLEKYELTGGSEGLNIKLRFGAFWNSPTIKQNREKTGFVDGYHIELM
jgi:peptidoglycan L-alanyl-D-glutamate endopeptidase CwlK